MNNESKLVAMGNQPALNAPLMDERDRADLQRYREREPLVKDLLSELDAMGLGINVTKRIRSVRDFKV
jgi:hypothetical protein